MNEIEVEKVMGDITEVIEKERLKQKKSDIERLKNKENILF
jgi:hypothetical protein